MGSKIAVLIFYLRRYKLCGSVKAVTVGISITLQKEIKRAKSLPALNLKTYLKTGGVLSAGQAKSFLKN